MKIEKVERFLHNAQQWEIPVIVETSSGEFAGSVELVRPERFIIRERDGLVIERAIADVRWVGFDVD
jgi:hypothetical protein